MTKCVHIVVTDPAYPANYQHPPSVGYCQTHACVLGSGGCERARIEELESAIRRAISSLERAYGDLPADRYPGPPITIIENLRSALGRTWP